MSGWVPVPREALALCSGPLERSAVLDLYERAHALRWRPLRVTERSLCTSWGLGNRRVWTLLDDLVGAGLIRVERGGNRLPTTIVVLSPTADGPSEVRQSGQQSGQQNGPVATPAIATPAAQDAAQDAATLSETLDREEEHTSESDEPTADAVREAWTRLAGRWRELHPVGPAPQPRRGQGAQLLARIREHGEDNVALVLRWAHHSQHERADFLRRRGLSLKTLMQATNFEEYLGFAAEERPKRRPGGDVPGKPVRPSPPPASTRTAADIAQLEALLRRKTDDHAA